MTRGVDQIVQLLAASGLSEKAILDGLRDLERLGHKRGATEVRRLREFLLFSDLQVDVRGPRESTERVHDQIVDQVTLMLLGDAKLSPVQAAQLLGTLIAERSPRLSLPAFRSRDGFRNWLARVSLMLPSSELLHHASKLRNDVVHLPAYDWKLKERSED